MKRAWFVWAAMVLAGAPAFSQQQTNEVESEAMKVLRRAMKDYERNPKAAAKAATEAARSGQMPLPGDVPPATNAPATAAPAPAKPEPTFAEMEQMYLDGKISAKDFQKYLQNQKLKPVRVGDTAQATTPKPAATATVTNATTLPPPPADPAVTDVEKRLDELIRAQAEREKASTNRVTTPTGPRTKRQKLDDLLKALVDGKISDEDYKTQRAKVLAEPD